MLSILMIFAFILSFLGGYILGKGMIVIKPRLSKEEKREQKKKEEEWQEMKEKYNEAINEITGFGDY